MRISQDVEKKVSALITLLEDDNNDVAIAAMKELLTLDEKCLLSIMRELQESSDAKLRKRVHQLQSIIKIRDNRAMLSIRLKSDNASLEKGMPEIHLLWYDRDSKEFLKTQFQDFLAKAKLNKLDSIDKIAVYMKECNFTVSKNSELEPDSFCIGAILDTKVGSDVMLCALSELVADDNSDAKYQIICKNKSFLLTDTEGNYLDPVTWEVETIDNLNTFKKLENYNSGMILRFVVYQLLLCAMCMGSYRYVYTIGKCISETFSKQFPSDILDEPYNGKLSTLLDVDI
jgi:hypothetical protein